jgi:hypothetical protein
MLHIAEMCVRYGVTDYSIVKGERIRYTNEERVKTDSVPEGNVLVFRETLDAKIREWSLKSDFERQREKILPLLNVFRSRRNAYYSSSESKRLDMLQLDRLEGELAQLNEKESAKLRGYASRYE